MGRRLNLQVPAPCSESWEAMQPREGGRYCSSCTRTITDFTQMTDAELTDFVQRNGHACGRFRPDQLGRDLEAARKPWPGLRAFFAISLPAFLLSLKSVGQARMAIPTEISPSREASKAIMAAADSAGSVAGVVRDEYGNPVPFASIVIKGTRQGVSADEKGVFLLKAVRLPVTLTVSSVNFVPQSVRATGEPLAVTLRGVGERLVGTVGVVVVSRSTKKRKPSRAEAKAAKAAAAQPSILPYPNPVSAGSDLTVQGSNLEPGAYRLELYNLAGQLLQRGSAVCSAKTDRMQLSTAGVPAGNYILRVVNEKTGKALSSQVVVRN
ncbi:carboxypeptidase-like regulatory domain-containing protein [Flaviaesturariibacter terrae]